MSIHKSKQIVLQMCLICALAGNHAPSSQSSLEENQSTRPISQFIAASDPEIVIKKGQMHRMREVYGLSQKGLHATQECQKVSVEELIDIHAQNGIVSFYWAALKEGPALNSDTQAQLDQTLADIGIARDSLEIAQEELYVLALFLVEAKRVIQDYFLEDTGLRYHSSHVAPHSYSSIAGRSMTVKLQDADGFNLELTIHQSGFKFKKTRAGEIADFLPGTAEYYRDPNASSSYVRQNIDFFGDRDSGTWLANNFYQAVLAYLDRAETEAKQQKQLKEAEVNRLKQLEEKEARDKTSADMEARNQAERKKREEENKEDQKKRDEQGKAMQEKYAREEAYRNRKNTLTSIVSLGSAVLSGCILDYFGWNERLNAVHQLCFGAGFVSMSSAVANTLYERLNPMPAAAGSEPTSAEASADTLVRHTAATTEVGEWCAARLAQTGEPVSEEVVADFSEELPNADEVEGLRLRASQIASNQA